MILAELQATEQWQTDMQTAMVSWELRTEVKLHSETMVKEQEGLERKLGEIDSKIDKFTYIQEQ